MTALDPRALRHAFGRFMTGVTVVTTRTLDGTPLGFTANSFSSVSLDPALLLVCPGRYLSCYQAFESCTHFAVNILSDGQEPVSNIFASGKGDRFAQVPHHLNAQGVPLLDGAIARFSCKTHQVFPAGDHAILMGEITEFDQSDAPGLGYVGGRYLSLAREARAAQASDAPATCGAIVECLDGVLLQNSAEGLRPVEIPVVPGQPPRSALETGVAARGLDAQLRQVYSAFHDPRTQRRFTYFLVEGEAKAAGSDIKLVPIAELQEQRFATPAIATMMTRFAAEARARAFSLYLGDADHGDIHPQRS